MVKVKICGITNVKDARIAVDAGADFLGLNFYRGSSRYVTLAAAKRIARTVRNRVLIVGVFVNDHPARVLEIARRVGLDYVQLHGDETPEVVAKLRHKSPVIKAIRIRGGDRAARLDRFDRASAFLLDGFDRSARGGTGKTFDWKIAARVGQGRRIFLAGGLNGANAADAIRIARPYAIDVCSGVESAATPRKKDAAKIAALMTAVRGVRKSSKRGKRK
jgi:phosphoribosylanthranilate isomerase